MRWQPMPQECELIADMLAANRPKAALTRFVYVSESTLRRFLARVRGDYFLKSSFGSPDCRIMA